MMKYLLLAFTLWTCLPAGAQQIDPSLYWQGKERTLRYQPDGEEFVITNGDKRFTRAIYGTNTGFRFETSDFPEFGLYMPRLGGSIYLAIASPSGTQWIREMEWIESRFKSGQRTYSIKDKKHLGNGVLTIDAVALSDGDGLIIKYQAEQIPAGTRLLWIYGGAGNQRFSREGDLGADPADCFFIKPQHCKGNIYEIRENRFTLYYRMNSREVPDDELYENPKTGDRTQVSATAPPSDALQLTGVFPLGTTIREADGNRIDDLPGLLTAERSACPVIVAEYTMGSDPFYMELHNPKSRPHFTYKELAAAFEQGIIYRTRIASRMKVRTPDPFFNTLGGIFAGAEDAVWEDPGYLHGAIGWRVPLTGWRAAYLADLLGIRERARTHFNGYIRSQVTDVPVTLPHLQDTALHLARSAKQWGTPMYSNGYICRSPGKTDAMYHYDMNLVFIDELLWHLHWTGDLEYAREIFPVLQRHLAWEKNTYDPDNDGLYDAYCCIWASDALQYNGGKVTHSSAYNYRANRLTAELARKIGEDPLPYEQEAERILSAINRELWVEDKGWWAEFKDNMGHRMRHEEPALWTFYHAIDSEIHDPFQAYQASRYIDTRIAHISVVARNYADTTNYVVATTNWQPYMWSINNVAFAEITHTALAYWQSGRPEEAYRMYKGAILDAMYLGSGPGNITQVSFYDAARGETYRDFADPVAMAVRALVQGMFGIIPDLTNNRLTLRPGFPADWEFAELETQHIRYSYSRKEQQEQYRIVPLFAKADNELFLEVNARYDRIPEVAVNGKSASCEIPGNRIGQPAIRIHAGRAEEYDIVITWQGEPLVKESMPVAIARGEELNLRFKQAPLAVKDPQGVLSHSSLSEGCLTGKVTGTEGYRTLFVETSQGDFTYWRPVDIQVKSPVEIRDNPKAEKLEFTLTNNKNSIVQGRLCLNGMDTQRDIRLLPGNSEEFSFDNRMATLGTNQIVIRNEGGAVELETINWNIPNPREATYRTVSMAETFNDKVTHIFEYGKYLSPRWPYTTLQVPTQGMGQWCHPTDLSLIDDSGLRALATQNKDIFRLPQGIPFLTPGEKEENNILFTTLWDNYPASATVPLAGKASKAYLFVAASTYHMQAHLLNGRIAVNYKDGSQEKLELILPDNLLPLDQDIFIDDWAFRADQPRPWRIRLQNGNVSKYHAGELNKQMSNDPIYVEGGLVTLLDLPLDREKELESLTLETIANEVIIGLMGVTLME
ncbi:MAG: DUF4450 domain-containing protein [Bacteroides sp.]|nr:DUF4450 domain-containing protein [Bacteroides sp.]